MSPIITRKKLNLHTHWQWELGQAFTCPQALLDYLEIPSAALKSGFKARDLFPMRVPYAFAKRMEKGNLADPLLRQVLPVQQEFDSHQDFSQDPLEEQQGPLPGMLHKYQSRVLILFKNGCAINCRYCFRRYFPYETHQLTAEKQAQIIMYLKQQPQVNEVILSGGDPMMARDKDFDDLMTQLETLPQIKRMRIHSRLCTTIPSRITPALVTRFAQSRLNIILVTHINHGQEIDDAVAQALQPLRHLANVTLLNQSVLLKGVNDDSDSLSDLSEKLFAVGILPYYLHQLDKVQGSAHFQVCDQQARQLMHRLLARLPGFLVPQLTKEIPGQASKVPIDLRLE